MKVLKEAYLDDNEQFYDYRTAPVTGKEVFDTNTTGMSFYDELIHNPSYMEKAKNLVGTIKYMTPMEYFRGCADIFNSTVDKQIMQTKADKNTLDHLMTVLNTYKKTFPIGFLNYANGGQEGRHRMLVAAEYAGWDTKQPVLVIEWADIDRHNREEAAQQKRDADIAVKDACRSALHYRYSNIEELRNEIQLQLNMKFAYDEDRDVSFDMSSDESSDEFVIKCNGGEYSFGYSDVNWTEGDSDDFDIDDLDLDELPDGDLDSWLKTYLGESLHGPSLAETLEKHDTLNPAIWDGEELKDGIQDAILEIVGKYIEDSEVLSIDDVIDVELLGSNASFNYTAHSDLDIHIVVNMEALSSDPALVQIACNAEKALFNKAYNFTIKGVEVELYVEDVKAATASNGIFSVTNDEWIKKPQPIDIPDMTDDESYISLLDTWMVRAKQAMNSKSSKDVQSFINELYNLRRLSIMTDGEYARGNLVFKEIRNTGLLSDLKDLLNELSSKELSLESLQ